MLTASTAIKKALQAKEQGILSGTESMLAILSDLHGQVMTELGKAALGSFDAYHLRQMLDSIEYQVANYTLRAKAELSDRLSEAWNLGTNLVDLPLAVSGIRMGSYHLSTAVLDTLKDYSNDYLQNLFGDAWYKVKGEITLGVVGGKTPQEVAESIGKTMDAGQFKNIAARAETITRHEMGTVFSKASQLRMEQAAESVPEMEKQWIHAGHPFRPRPSHITAHGKHVPVNESFVIGGVPMMFPRDPKAPLKETMNCGCDHVPYHPDWE